uniref:Uncharacterized protein n=1 Tax=Timema cristinae TaxID=61476 RepID=A0A7R9D5L4_TIMCR|nr:unnamed protein product [Timema cristinae]
MRQEVQVFFSDSKCQFSDRFTNEQWLCRLVFMAYRVLDARPFFQHWETPLKQTYFQRKKRKRLLNCPLKKPSNLVSLKTSLAELWLQRLNEFPHIADRDINFILPFSIYLCESVYFFSIMYLKNKYQIRLNLQQDPHNIDTCLILQGKWFVSLHTVVERRVRQLMQQWESRAVVSKFMISCNILFWEDFPSFLSLGKYIDNVVEIHFLQHLFLNVQQSVNHSSPMVDIK